MGRKARAILISLIFILISQGAFCALKTWNVASGNWSVPGNWTGGLPVAGDDISIPSGTCNIDAGAVPLPNLRNFSLSAGALLTVAAPATLTLSGAVNIQGTFPTSGLPVVLNGATAQTLTMAAGSSAGNLTVSSTSTVTLQSDITLAGNLSITGGTLDANNAGNYTIKLAGGWSRTGGGAFTARLGTVNFNNSAAQTITGTTTFYNLTVSGSNTVSLAGSPSPGISVTNNLTISSGTFSLGTFAGTGAEPTLLTVGGNVSVTGTLTSSGITGYTTNGGVYLLTVNGSATINSGGTVTTGDNTIWLSDASGGGGGLVMNGGTLDFSAANSTANTIVGTGPISGTGIINAGGKGTIRPQGNVDLTGIAYTPGQTRLTFAGGTAGTPLTLTTNGASIASIRLGSSVLGMGAVVRLVDDLNLTGNVSTNGAISCGTNTGVASGFDVTGRTITIGSAIAAGGDVDFSATPGAVLMSFTSTGSTFIFTGTNTLTPNGATTTFNNVQVNNGASLTLGAALTTTGTVTADGAFATGSFGMTVGGSVSIGATGSFTAGSSSISVTGNWSNSGAFTAGTSTVSLTPATGGTSQVLGTTTFNILSCTVANSTIQFQAGNTQTISNATANTGFIMIGTAGNYIQLQSTVPTTQWILNVSVAQSVSYVAVRDGNVTPAAGGPFPIAAANSYNVANNKTAGPGGFWNFTSTPGTFTWSGNNGTTWNNGLNWVGGAVPGQSDNVTIPNFRPNYPLLTTPVTVGSLTLNGGNFQTGGNSLTITTAFGGNGGLIQAAASTLTALSNETISVDGTITLSGTFTRANSTLTATGGILGGPSYNLTTTAASQPYNLTVNMGSAQTLALGSAVTVNGALTQTSGTINLNARNLSVSGNASIAGTIQNTGAAANFSVTGTTTVTANASVSSSGGNITFTGAVDGQSAGSQSLTVSSTGGTVSFGSATGSSFSLSSLSVTSTNGTATAITIRSVTTTGTQTYTGNVTLGGAATLTTTNNNVTFTAAVNGAQTLSIGVGNAAVSLGTSVGASTALGGVSVTASGTTSLPAVTTSGAQSYIAATSTTLNGTLTVNAAGAGVSFTGPVVLGVGGGAITLTGSSGGNNVTFSGTSTVNATTAGTQSLSIAAGGGPVSFGAAVGGGTPLGGVTVSASGTTSLLAVTTTGAQSYTASTSTTLNATLTVNTAGAGVSFTGPVVLGAGSGTITLTGSSGSNNVTFSASSTVNATTAGAESLSITATGGPVSFGAAVGGGTPLGGVTVSASGTTSLLGVTTTGAQSYTASTSTTLNGTLTVNTAGAGVSFTGPVILAGTGATITLTGTNVGNNVTFNASSTVNATTAGSQSLTITAGGGPVGFGAAVGGGTPLGGVTVSASGTTSLLAVTTTGAQSYTASTSTTLNATLTVNTAGAGVSFTGPVLLAAGGGAITLTGTNAANNVTFNATATVSGAQALSITAGGGTVTMDDAVGSPTSLTSLTITSAAQFTTAAAGTISVFGAGAISITADGASIGAAVTTGSGLITIQPATNTQTIGINDAAGGLNLTAAELSFLTTSSTVTIGSTTGTGAITVGSVGTINLTAKAYDLLIRSASGNLTFNFPAAGNSLSLGNTHNLSFATGTGTITHLGSATSDITLTGATGGALAFTSGQVGLPGTLLPVSVPVLGTSTVTGGFYLTNSAALSVTGLPVSASGNIQITVTGGATLSVPGTVTNGGGATSVGLTANDMSLTGTITAGSGAVNLTTVTAGQAITIGGGLTPLGLSGAELNTITTTGILTIGDVLHTGSITLDGNINLTGPTGPVVLQTSGGTITLNTPNTFVTAGNLTLDTRGSGAATGAVTGTGQLTIGSAGAGSLTVNASTGISLTNVLNQANAVSLNNNASSSVTYDNNRAMTLTASNSAPNGVVSVVNATGTLTTSGNVTTSGTGTTDISLQTAGLLTVANAVTASGAGGISLTGNGVTLNTTILVTAGSGPIMVNGSTGAIQLNDGTLTTTNNTVSAVTIRNATNVTLGNITANSGSVVLGVADISGAVTQNAATTISSASLAVNVSAGSTVALTNTTNAIPILASVTRGGAFSLTDSVALAVNGAIAAAIAADPVTITTTGTLNINAGIAANNNAISLTGAGLTIAAGLSINPGTGTILVDGGTGPVQLTTSTLTTTNATTTAVTVQHASTVALGTISATGTFVLGTAALPITSTISENGGAGSVTAASISIACNTMTYSTSYAVGTDFTVAAGTVTLGRALNISGTITIALGAVLDVGAGDWPITLGANWTNNANVPGFVARNGTVTLNAGSPSITVGGSNTFFDLVCTVAGTTILFQAGGTETVATGGNFTLTGTAAQHIIVNTTLAPTRWLLNLQGSATISFVYVDVYYSDASFNPILTPANVNAGPTPPTAFNDIGWLTTLDVTASEIRDLNHNGKIDAIYVTTAAAINDNFTGFRVNVVSTTGVPYTVVGFADPGPTSSNFYIYLQEKPYLDTGVTLTWTITQNTTLLDNATGAKTVVIPAPPAVTTDAAPPVLGYSLAVVGNNQIFVHFSEPVYGAGGAVIVSTNFTFTTGALPALSVVPGGVVRVTAPTGNGTSEALLTLNRTVTAEDISLPVMMQLPGVVDAAPVPGPYPVSMNASGHRISDIGLGQLTDGMVEPVWAHDETIRASASTGVGLVPLGGFDGSKWLRAHQNLSVEGHVHAVTTPPGSLSLLYDMNVSASLQNAGGLWLPGFVDDTTLPGGFSGLVPSGSTGDVNATTLSGTSPATLLWDFLIPRTDTRSQDNAKVGFLFQMPLQTGLGGPTMYTGRVENPAAADWYRHVTPWSFDLHDIRTQRGGATILNNVIHPERGEVATLQYTQDSAGPVSIMVFDLSGSIVNVLARIQSQAAGDYACSWDGRNRGNRVVARGIYFIRIVAPGIDETRKVLVVR